MVSEVELGESGTTAWYIGGLDRNTTLTFLLDLPNHLEKVNPA
jgi:protein transport protein SEC23